APVRAHLLPGAEPPRSALEVDQRGVARREPDLARALGPVRALHVVLELVLEDVRLARKRHRAPALAQLQRMGRALRRGAEQRARAPARRLAGCSDGE